MPLSEFIKQSCVDFFDLALSSDDPDQSLPRVYARLHTLSEGVLTADEQASGTGLACQQACAHCCYLPVMCPPQVVFHVVRHIRQNWHPQQIDTLLEKLDSLTRPYLETDPVFVQGIRQRCAFLGQDDRCSIYAVRPISCRAFTSKNVTACAALARQDEMLETGVPQIEQNFELHQAATTSLVAAGRKQGRFADQVYFLPAVRAVLQSPDLENRWLGGEEVRFY